MDVFELKDSEIILAYCFLNELKSNLLASENTLRAYATDLSQFFAESGQVRYQIKPVNSENRLQLFIENQLILLNLSEISLHPIPSQKFTNLLTGAFERWSRLSPASRNRKAACLKAFAKWLAENELIDKDIRHHIHAPKVPQKIPHFLSLDEIQSLFGAIEQAKSEGLMGAERDEALILLLYGGGLRVSEACSVKWEHLDLSKRTLLVDKTKGARQRLIVLPSPAARKLSALERTGAYIFGDQPLHPRTAYNTVRHWGARAGLNRPLNPHALRHSYATHLLSDGADLRILGELLGHKSLMATQKYTHLSMDQLSRTMSNHHPLAKMKNRPQK